MKWARLLASWFILSSVFGLRIERAVADSIEQAQKYNVNSFYDYAGAASLYSTLRAIGTHGYFYVDDRYWSYMTPAQQTSFIISLQQLSQQFDDAIYPASVKLWGSEANPGVDGDSHVVILLQRLINGSGGYFENIHNYSKEQSPLGNAREMLFINADSVLAGNAKTLIAHELQHLISFNQRELAGRMDEDVWLNEARSEYNTTAVGYGGPTEFSSLQRRVVGFLRAPSDSLTVWPNTSTDYAITSIFAHYLVGHYGEAILSETGSSKYSGTAALHDWLKTNKNSGFSDVFVSWMVANALNDRGLNSLYGYTQAELSSLRVLPETTESLSLSRKQISRSSRLQEWQPRWLTIPIESGVTSNQDLTLRISGSSESSLYGAIMMRYRNGFTRVLQSQFTDGRSDARVPMWDAGSEIQSVTFAVAQGSLYPLERRKPIEETVMITASIGDLDESYVSPLTDPIAPTSERFAYVQPRDGDLIRRKGQSDIYVVWGPYRRLLTPTILALYGFQNREIRDVPDDVFFHYAASVYIRALGSKKVYAVWADGSKHWFDISAQQWEASGRDWSAIFTVNDAEVSAYPLGTSITR
ncbi:MAG: hypothetical protein KBC02_00270 [Candidatus Pacebacteria bacterium]|nr:hypothetical protein [Candidatus Paceibacterota bacterium]